MWQHRILVLDLSERRDGYTPWQVLDRLAREERWELVSATPVHLSNPQDCKIMVPKRDNHGHYEAHGYGLLCVMKRKKEK